MSGDSTLIRHAAPGLLLAAVIAVFWTGSVFADHEPDTRCKNPKPHPQNCLIKGNISRNGWIYHAPGKSRWYSRTCINKPGERWFCSEEEARKAGWRAPRG